MDEVIIHFVEPSTFKFIESSNLVYHECEEGDEPAYEFNGDDVLVELTFKNEAADLGILRKLDICTKVSNMLEEEDEFGV